MCVRMQKKSGKTRYLQIYITNLLLRREKKERKTLRGKTMIKESSIRFGSLERGHYQQKTTPHRHPYQLMREKGVTARNATRKGKGELVLEQSRVS